MNKVMLEGHKWAHATGRLFFRLKNITKLVLVGLQKFVVQFLIFAPKKSFPVLCDLICISSFIIYFNPHNDLILYGKVNTFIEEFYLHFVFNEDAITSNSEDTFLPHKYIQVDDSLRKLEGRVSNNLEKIHLENDEPVFNNPHLFNEKKWLLAGYTGLLSLTILVIILLVILLQRNKVKYQADMQVAEIENLMLVIHREREIEAVKWKIKEAISRELHDGALGKLFGIRFMLNSLNQKRDIHSLESRGKFLEELREVEEEIRHISHNLQNKPIPQIDFPDLIRNLIEERAHILGFTPLFNSDSQILWENFENDVKINLYRIIQEALQNVSKHANAKIAIVTFVLVENKLKLKIVDNGGGFDLNEAGGGIGLKNIKCRVKGMKGDLRIVTSETGTELIIQIPYKNVKCT